MIIIINGKTRNYILLAVLIATALCLIAAFSMKAEEDIVNKENYIHYQQALNLINQKRYVQAQTMLKQLDKNYLQAYQVQLGLGICSATMGNYTEAENYMNQAQATRPALLNNQIFLVEFGRLLYMQGVYSQAKLYFLESKKYNSNPEITRETEKYLAQIEIKEKGGR